MVLPFADIVPLGTRIGREMTYRVTDDLFDPKPGAGEPIAEGSRVLVPLGTRWATGIVVGFRAASSVENVRDIVMCLDPYPVLVPEVLRVCQWIAGYYLCTLAEVLTAALPAGIHTHSDQRVSIAPEAEPNGSAHTHALTDKQRAVVDALSSDGDLTLKQLERRVGRGARSVVYRLVRRGVLSTQQEMVAPRVRATTARVAHLLPDDPDWFETELPALRRRAPKQAACVERLRDLGGRASSRDLAADGINANVLRRLVERQVLRLDDEEVVRDPYAFHDDQPPDDADPTADQASALNLLTPDVKEQRFRVHLLHGVTGSGKTLVYIRAVAEALDAGRGAIVLIPEIALTPQTVRRFRAHFGDDVAVLHSALSSGERYDAWRQVREGRRRVVVGARSAVFAPVRDLGLIVVDEEHDGSYKQENPAPRYNARDVAVVRGQHEGFPVILGSATPSLESTHNAQDGKYHRIDLPDRIDGRPLPEVALVDMRQEGGDLFSAPLRTRIQDRLHKGERTILLQNRRGYAPFIQCTDCGTSIECADCQVTLTLHGGADREGSMICHYCGRSEPRPQSCLACGSTAVRLVGSGTQRVEEALSERFPDARVLRMDVDTTTTKGAHAKILDAFGRGEADILLGTQMVAKGLDFPGVTLVGVISADTGLYLPDFRASERTFQLLTQVAGRAGRGDRPGEVIIQTYRPEETPLQYACGHDFSSYAEQELASRSALGYPPFGRMALFLVRGPDESLVALAANHCAEALRARSDGLEVLGPVQAPIARIQGHYRWQVIAKSDSTRHLNAAARAALDHHRFRGIRLSVDVDPISFL